jgi:hypothetical protein
MVVPRRPCSVQPGCEFVEDWDVSDAATLRRSFLETSVAVRGAGSPNGNKSAPLIDVVPAQPDEFPESQPSKREARERPLPERSIGGEFQHAPDLQVIECPGCRV